MGAGLPETHSPAWTRTDHRTGGGPPQDRKGSHQEILYEGTDQKKMRSPAFPRWLGDDLDHLHLADNPISDINPRVANPGIDSGDPVYLYDIQLDCNDQRENILTLLDRGVALP